MRSTGALLLLSVFLATSIGFLLPASFAQGLTPSEERTQLEQELEELEQQIAGIEGDITKTQAEKKSFQSNLTILRQKIKKLDLQISQSNKLISDLRAQITDTGFSIEKTSVEIQKTQGQLADILQRIYRKDLRSPVEIVLTGPTLSDFFSEVADLQALNGRSEALLLDMVELNSYLENQKNALSSEKEEEENFVKIQLIQKQQSQGAQSETEQLLETTKGKESVYQQLLANSKQRAQEIRSRIFELIGVPTAPTFGEAVDIAEIVSQQTSVRTSLLLAVLTQESNLGQNVGQCFLRDPKTGSGVSVRTGNVIANVIKPMELSGRRGDVDDFVRITTALGRDPYNTPVSCPIPSVGGYGGAMGPAQFIPTTWTLYEGKIANAKGSLGDPWNIKDAFLASGLLLADNGATSHSYNAEWAAAMRYFSGGTNLRYRFYGDNVMAIAQRYDEDIATLRSQ